MVLLTYGTSGFRAQHKQISDISEKIGFALACAVVREKKSFGIMITASHNHYDDNGVKIVDHQGHMINKQTEDHIIQDMQQGYANQLEGACSEETKDDLYHDQIAIQIGYDSRESSPDISNLIVKGIRLVHPRFPLVITPYITTPHLHFIFSDQGHQISYSNFVRNSDTFVDYPCILDCAHGIGAKLMLEVLSPSSSITLINTDWEDTKKLNENCSSDYVCTYKQLPLCEYPDGLNNKSPTLRASLDGDADRVVFYYVEPVTYNLQILNGDYIAALIFRYLSRVLTNVQDLSIGFVYTGYTNSACVDYIKSLPFPENVSVSCVCTATGVKHLHAEAEKYDIGVYFEQNGHGNVLFRHYPSCLDILVTLYHPNIGDGVLDLYSTLYILQTLEMNVQDWRQLYTEKHVKMSKIEVPDKNLFSCTPNELELVEPAHIQHYIGRLKAAAPYPFRAFVRASGTENVVRLFVESTDANAIEIVAYKITQYIKRTMNNAHYESKGSTFLLRPLKVQDLGETFYELLGQLTKIDVEKMDEEQSSSLFQRLDNHHRIYVLEEEDTCRVIGTGTLLIEEKFLRNYGKVGHIEDIVVHSDFRGYGLGKVMVDFLTKQAKLADCYKCILDCGESNVAFYEKCDYERKGVQMAIYW
jgi:phosphoacetylglucosamine mutase